MCVCACVCVCVCACVCMRLYAQRHAQACRDFTRIHIDGLSIGRYIGKVDRKKFRWIYK